MPRTGALPPSQSAVPILRAEDKKAPRVSWKEQKHQRPPVCQTFLTRLPLVLNLFFNQNLPSPHKILKH
jgi:hypothetical protein